MTRFATVAVAGLFAMCSLAAAEEAASWPEFHGPLRNNISPETGLLKEWPEEGPELAWRYDECGIGFSGVSIADGRIYSAGDFDDEHEMVFALDLRGRLLWKTANGPAWTGPTPGSHSTPTYNDGMVYHMTPLGRLAAFAADTGKEVWAVDLKERFGARYGLWAMCENLFVDDDKVLCLPGGGKALAAALDKKTGKTVWTTPGGTDKAAYGSPVVGKYKGVRMYIVMTYDGVVCVNVENGEMLWNHPFRRLSVSQNATTPVFHEGHVFITCGHMTGGLLLKINDDLKSVSKVWFKQDFDNCHGCILNLDGKLYGCGCRLGGKNFWCVDLLTGEVKGSEKGLGKVSISYADGRIYALEHKGTMHLLKPTGAGVERISKFKLPRDGVGLYLSHPVICGGRMYLRQGNALFCYDIAE